MIGKCKWLIKWYSINIFFYEMIWKLGKDEKIIK